MKQLTCLPAVGLTAALGALLVGSSVQAADWLLGGVAAANPRIAGLSQPNIIASGYALDVLASDTDPLENPSGVITMFGRLNDFPPQPIEATHTESDENVYLVLDHNPGGPTAGYDYGRHFLFQGHENGNGLAYVTRINLDIIDPAHHITLCTPVDPLTGKTGFTRIDGNIYNPFTKSVLFSQENGPGGGVIEVSVDWPSTAGPNIRTHYGSMGRGSYEGMRLDDRGNILIAEDVGGTSVSIDKTNKNGTKATRNPNSYIYRFLPYNPADLSQGGKLQALQVAVNGAPVKFVPVDAARPFGAVFTGTQLLLHTPGTSWPIRWVDVHDSAVSAASFDANALARAAGATPFKRPENLAYQPGSGFQTFFFVPTGDTDARAGAVPDLAARGAWGSIFRVDLDASRNGGQLSIFFVGDQDHAGFDNIIFAREDVILVGEDRGDNLHRQLNRLDSVWAFKVGLPSVAPSRFLALGRDAAATIDAAFLDAATPGYQNDGDNEPTGVFVSDGDDTISGLLGTTNPGPNARSFITQQHGQNTVFEIRVLSPVGLNLQ